MLVMMASEQASFMTGSELIVDGGCEYCYASHFYFESEAQAFYTDTAY